MSSYVYQFHEVAVDIEGDRQELVQKVSVKADTGLEFVTIPVDEDQQVYKKNKNISIDIEYLASGYFEHPTGCPLYNSLGTIILRRKKDPTATDIEFSGCVLTATKSKIDTSSWGTKTLTYMALSYKNISHSDTWTETTPKSGDAKQFSRICYSGVLEDEQLSYESSCTIDRELLYNPTKNKPDKVCIKYPITCTSSVSRYEKPTADGLYDQNPLGCPTGGVPSGSGGIPNGYLVDVSVDGATVGGDVQILTYGYKSTKLTPSGSLTRILDIN